MAPALRSKASNAALAKARAMYGDRLTPEDYRRLAACRSIPQLAAELKNLPAYTAALEPVSAPTARRAQLEALLRQAVYGRCDSLFRYELSAGQQVYGYFTVSCEVDEIITCLRCLDAGRPGDYLFKLPDYLRHRCTVDLYALAHVTDAKSLLAALAGTPYRQVLAPLADVPAGRKLLVYAEPLLEDYRHKAFVALAPQKSGSAPGRAPGLRDYIEMECDAAALSNAGRLLRVHAEPRWYAQLVRRDCTALKPAEWQALLAAPDYPAYLAALHKTVYGRMLDQCRYSTLKEGLQKCRYNWCRKWLRFSTDPALVMLCYVYLIRCEVTNLEHIIEGVHYGMPADELYGMLIGCDEENSKGREH